MKREPSLHIKESQLIQVLEKIKALDDSVTFDAKELGRQILKRSKTYSLLSRSMVLSEEKQIQKAKKITSSTRDIAQTFNLMLTITRKQLKHIGIVMITESHKDWPMLKQIAQDAENFRKEFDLPDRKEAYQIYIKIGLSKISKFALFKFVNLYESICLGYEASNKIRMYDDQVGLKNAWETYRSLIVEKTGSCFDYSSTPDKYNHFAEANETSKKLGAKIADYIKAQFHELEWTNGIPDPAQLVGPKAEERFMKFAYKMNLDLKTQKPTRKINFKEIKNLR